MSAIPKLSRKLLLILMSSLGQSIPHCSVISADQQSTASAYARVRGRSLYRVEETPRYCQLHLPRDESAA